MKDFDWSKLSPFAAFFVMAIALSFFYEDKIEFTKAVGSFIGIIGFFCMSLWGFLGDTAIRKAVGVVCFILGFLLVLWLKNQAGNVCMTPRWC